MADEIIKTVENVDRLFSEIVVNGESHVSDNYVPPVQLGQTVPQTVEEEEEPQNTAPAQSVQGQDVYAVELNSVHHDFTDRDLTQELANEVQNRQDADTALQNSINTINSKIPNQASSENQLADKNFVNSSIATNTANFIGTFESVADLLAYSGTVTNNDYAFVRNTVIQYNGGDFPDVTTLNNYDKTNLTNGDYAWVVNAEDNTKYDLYKFDIVEQVWFLIDTKIDKSPDVLNSSYNRYKATVSGSTVTWAYEYTLNNSSFTASQWATINSGLTQESVDEDIAEAIAEVGSGIEVYPTEEDIIEDLPNIEEDSIVACYGDDKGFNDAPLGSIIAYYGTSDPVGGKWLILDGRDTTGTDIELQTHYPSLYLHLGGTNVLPDLRECVPVGIGQNGTDTIATHDVYTLGQFKDDQFKSHNHGETFINGTPLVSHSSGSVNGGLSTAIDGNRNGNQLYTHNTGGTTTHGKQKGVNWIIKAVSTADVTPLPSESIQEIEGYVEEYVGGKTGYSTTEIDTGAKWIDGKTIYRKVIDFGALPNTADKAVNHNITNLDKILLIRGTTTDGNGSNPLPYVSPSNIIFNIMLYATNTQVCIRTGSDRSAYTQTYIILEYTKS